MFSRKILLRCIWIAALLVIFAWVALQGTLVAIRVMGNRQWTAERKALLAKGEKLMLRDFEPPAVNDEENFFAGPLWVQDDSDPARGLPVLDLLPPLTIEEMASLEKRYPDARWKSKDRSKRQTILAGVTPKADEPPGVRRRQAELTLDLLGPAKPFTEFLETRATLPKAARFPLDYQTSHYDLAQPYLTPMMTAARVFSGRALARLEVGDSAGASADVRTLLLLEKKLNVQPTMVCWLVRLSILDMMVKVIQRGLELHAWNDRELAEIEQQLAALEITPGYLLALRSERGSFNQCVESVMAKLKKSSGQSVWGIFGQDQVLFNRLMQDWIERVEAGRTEGFRGPPTIEAETLEIRMTTIRRQFYLLTLLTTPALPGSEMRYLELQNRVGMARVACALERYRLAKGDYPETLGELVPAYLAALPVDAVDRAPFKYRRMAEGKYQLYSVALNREDDHAVTNENLDWVWGVDREKKGLPQYSKPGA